MSVIAWDGKTLAADRRMLAGSLIRTTDKIFRCRDITGERLLCGYSGDVDAGEEMRAWFERGASPADFPTWLRDKDDLTGFFVIYPSGDIARFERTAYPVVLRGGQTYAVGSGRDFATAAMHLGKTAREAVEIACLFDCGCGNGVTELAFEGARNEP